jgi:DNA excision repair protein ERCC-2
VATDQEADVTPEFMRFFPYEEPYENQRDAMGRIQDALQAGENVLFEGACGTGKTLSALAPALEHARAEDKTVVITTNVHQQMRQFVAEARSINRQEPIRAVVFRGKSSMCHLDVGYEECQVLRDATFELVEAERDHQQLERRQAELLDASRDGEDGAAKARGALMDELDRVESDLEDLQERNTCEYYYENLTRDTDGFYEWLFEDVRTPDEIYEFAHDRGLCGYELLKDGIDDVDLVVCNYHHLLDPMIREQFFRWLDRDPDDVIAVFDEAHNVESAARDHATRTLTERTLGSALDELEGLTDARAEAAENVLSAFHRALVDVYEERLGVGRQEDIGEEWEDLAIDSEDGRDDLTVAFLQRYSGAGYDADLEQAIAVGKDLDEQYEEAYRSGESDVRKECQTLEAARFLSRWMEDGNATDQYPVVSVRRDRATETVYGRAELYTCIPRPVTRELFEEVHASILMSATLRPFDVTEDVLGLSDPATMAYGLTFPEERRRTFAVDTPPLFASERDDPSVQKTVANALAQAIEYTPGNVLVFFPSYAEAERYEERLPGDVQTYLDEPGERAEDLREAFVAGDDSALLTSLWGTLAEGVSFDGDDALTVVVVGVPYPYLDDRKAAVQDAYDATFANRSDAGWRYAVEIPTVRKTRQALGRVIRSPEEIGVRILLDRRYTKSARQELGDYSVHDTFPAEERAELVDVASEKLKFALLNFFTGYEAYDGPPPTP